MQFLVDLYLIYQQVHWINWNIGLSASYDWVSLQLLKWTWIAFVYNDAVIDYDVVVSLIFH